MPTGYTNRTGYGKGPHSHPDGVEKKVAKKPLKAVKEKLLRAKAKAVDKKAELKAGHAVRKAKWQDSRVEITHKKHFQDAWHPDRGSKATKERTNRNTKGDAKVLKREGEV
jgi:hypothetical protein